MGDRLRYNISAHQLFNSALILGVIVVRDPNAPHTDAILDDLQAYCNKQNADPWINDFDLTEVRVIELCISRARESRNQGQALFGNATLAPDMESSQRLSTSTAHPLTLEIATNLENEESYSNFTGFGGSEGQSGTEIWSDMWSNPGFYFPEPMDYQIWSDLVNNLAGK